MRPRGEEMRGCDYMIPKPEAGSRSSSKVEQAFFCVSLSRPWGLASNVFLVKANVKK